MGSEMGVERGAGGYRGVGRGAGREKGAGRGGGIWWGRAKGQVSEKMCLKAHCCIKFAQI